MTHFYISFSGPHNPFFLAEVCFEPTVINKIPVFALNTHA